MSVCLPQVGVLLKWVNIGSLNNTTPGSPRNFQSPVWGHPQSVGVKPPPPTHLANQILTGCQFAKVENMINFGGLPLKGDRINQFGQNLSARKHRMLVYSCVPNLTLIDHGGGYRSQQGFQDWPNSRGVVIKQ